MALTKSYLKDNDQVAQFLEDIENGEVQKIPIYGSVLGNDTEINILKSTKDVFARELYLIYQNWAKRERV